MLGSSNILHLPNIKFRSLTRDVSQREMSPLKTLLLANIADMSTTLETSQFDMEPFAPVKPHCVNISDIISKLETFHPDRSWSNDIASLQMTRVINLRPAAASY